jgi:hypothetical protein
MRLAGQYRAARGMDGVYLSSSSKKKATIQICGLFYFEVAVVQSDERLALRT